MLSLEPEGPPAPFWVSDRADQFRFQHHQTHKPSVVQADQRRSRPWGNRFVRTPHTLDHVLELTMSHT